MAEPKESKPGDLSTLDGDALVARLATVKKRFIDADLRKSIYSNPEVDAMVAADRAETEAVLDECAVRLLDPGPEHLRAQILSDELERVRGLVARTVARGPLGPAVGYFSCVFCFEADDSHATDCQWPALVAESEKT